MKHWDFNYTYRTGYKYYKPWQDACDDKPDRCQEGEREHKCGVVLSKMLRNNS